MGMLDNLFGGNQPKARQKLKKQLNEGDFTTTDHQLLSSTTEWSTIATYQCSPQQRLAVGYGNANQEEDMGRVYAYIRTGEGTPAEITGKIRIIVTDNDETKIYPVFEHDGALLHGDLNDKSKLIPIPESRPLIGEDSYIKVQIKPDSAHATSGAGNDNVGWADSTESLLKVPITVYYL